MSVLLATLMLTALHSSALSDETVWLADERQIACAPSTIGPADTVTLTLAPGHGRELAVRRHSDETWHFLVVASPPAYAVTLASPEEFESMATLQVPASLTVVDWADKTETKVFLGDGLYTFYVSDNLESEVGGYSCTVKYQQAHGP